MSKLAGVLKEVLISTGDGTRVTQVALIAGVSRDAVYAQCDHKCNPSVDVIKAAYCVTGDVRLERALTPDGYMLVMNEDRINPTKPLAEELGDVLPSLGRWAEAVQNPGFDPGEADTLKMDLLREIEEAHKAFRIEAQNRRRSLKAVGER